MNHSMSLISGNVTRGAFFLVFSMALLFVLPTGPVFADEVSNEVPPTVSSDKLVQNDQKSQNGELSQETERKRFKLGLAVLFVAVASLFVMLLLISLIRLSRFNRRRLGLGKRSPRTAYIDAWSQYRLKDDPTENQANESEKQ